MSELPEEYKSHNPKKWEWEGRKSLFRDKLKEQYHQGSGVLRCQFCPTDYQIDYRFCKVTGMSVFCTIWGELGSDSDRSVWHARVRPLNAQEHGEQVGRTRRLKGVRLKKVIPEACKAGEISSAFQQGEPWKFDDILRLQSLGGGGRATLRLERNQKAVIWLHDFFSGRRHLNKSKTSLKLR